MPANLEHYQKDPDTLQKLRVGKIVKSTFISCGFKKKKDYFMGSYEIQFGFNMKKDNQLKTKQLKIEF